MKKYYVEKYADTCGVHELHHEDCLLLPNKENLRKIRGVTCDKAAKIKAQQKFPKVESCCFCMSI